MKDEERELEKIKRKERRKERQRQRPQHGSNDRGNAGTEKLLVCGEKCMKDEQRELKRKTEREKDKWGGEILR